MTGNRRFNNDVVVYCHKMRKMPTCPDCGHFNNQNLTQHLLYSNNCKKKSVKCTTENACPQIPNIIQFQSSAPSGDNVYKKRSMEDRP